MSEKPTAMEQVIFEFVQACDRERRLANQHREAKMHRDSIISKHFQFLRRDKTPEGLLEYDQAEVNRYASLARHQIERSRSVFDLDQGREES